MRRMASRTGRFSYAWCPRQKSQPLHPRLLPLLRRRLLHQLPRLLLSPLLPQPPQLPLRLPLRIPLLAPSLSRRCGVRAAWSVSSCELAPLAPRVRAGRDDQGHGLPRVRDPHSSSGSVRERRAGRYGVHARAIGQRARCDHPLFCVQWTTSCLGSLPAPSRRLSAPPAPQLPPGAAPALRYQLAALWGLATRSQPSASTPSSTT